MVTVTIDNKLYQVPDEVAGVMRDLKDEREFFKKVLCWIAFGHLQKSPVDLQTARNMARDAVTMDREDL